MGQDLRPENEVAGEGFVADRDDRGTFLVSPEPPIPDRPRDSVVRSQSPSFRVRVNQRRE